MKVPSRHCDARVQTVCADVMNLTKDKVKALSPQVLENVSHYAILIGLYIWGYEVSTSSVGRGM